CIEVMAAALSALARGKAVLPLRTVIRVPGTPNAFAAMPAWLGEPQALGAKIITVFPGNLETAFDSHQGAVLIFDNANGSLSAILEASAITTIRTAAVSAVATRALAREDATTLAMLGSGVQARSHLEAMLAVRKISSVRVWSRTTARAQTFVRQASQRF